MTYHQYTTWFDAHGETTGEHLCDAWNAKNSAELARCGDDPFCAMALQTPTWAPPTKVMLVMERVCGEALPVLIGTRNNGMRSLWCGDKISCGDVAFIRDGELIDADTDLPFTHDPTTAKYLNVCRPFDEAHMVASFRVTGSAANFDPISEPYGTPWGTAKGFKVGVELIYHAPPNHGHGAACTDCVGLMLHIAGVYDQPPNCVWCHGSGYVICDDERAGRVSPSHAAGGYAEWRRENPQGERITIDHGISEYVAISQVRGPQVEWTTYDETD